MTAGVWPPRPWALLLSWGEGREAREQGSPQGEGARAGDSVQPPQPAWEEELREAKASEGQWGAWGGGGGLGL